MVQAASAPVSLITFDTRDFTTYTPASGFARGYIKVTNGNHFKFYTSKRGADCQGYINEHDSSETAPTNWPAFLSLHAGDVVEVKAKNVSTSCGKSGANGYTIVSFRDGDEHICGWNATSTSSVFYVVNGTPVSYSEISTSVTLTADKGITCLRFYAYSSAQNAMITFECDLELYVNGVRYI